MEIKESSEQELKQLALNLNGLYVSENLITGSESPIVETKGIKSKAADWIFL